MSTAEAQIGVNTNLQKQDLCNLDISNLTPLSPEVISRQATINIGTIGHVAHGKSTVVKAISGVQTVRFKNELERNITIKLERISDERILALLKSPKLLRAFEARQEAKLKGPLRFANNNEDYTNVRQLRHRSASRLSSIETNNSGTTATQRGPSTTPSSGYESLNDHASIYSGDGYAVARPSKGEQRRGAPLTPTQTLQRREKSSSSDKRRLSHATTPPISKRRKSTILKSEYVVERIESLESINGDPVFFVKWLNYPAEQNTWESLANLSECALLEPFIEDQYTIFELTIASISADIEAEIERDASLVYDTSKLRVRELDAYEPLVIKADLILLAQFRDSGSRSLRQPEKIRKRLIELMLLKPFYYLRRQQLADLQAWRERMNRVENVAPIALENHVDLEVPDPEFQYIKESFPGAGVQIAGSPPIGCKCINSGGGTASEHVCAPSSKCCARMADSYFAYDKSGRLRIRPGEAIYECNSACACDHECVNRVIQRGRQNALCLFKTATGCGWGVRTERALRKGEFVCEYVGEIITAEEADERGRKYDAIGRTYLFDLDYNTTAESVYTVDAAVHGNVSHFINHSCDPNLAVFPFWIDNLDINMPRLAFFSLRPIKADEELTFDYIRTDMGDDQNDENEYKNLSEAEKVTCRCGAANCRKVLF